MSSVCIEAVTKTFAATGRSSAPVTAVDEVSLTIPDGEIFAVIGYSGAGKSTLVRLINGLEPVTSGTITVGGVEITSLPPAKLRQQRHSIGMIFQRFNLLRSRTVAGNIAYPLEVIGMPKAQRRARVAELLEFVGLADKAKAHPEQLSGGQQQRVGIARALAAKPGLLLADEATSALDPETTEDVLNLLKRINRDLGVTVVVITHEMDVVTRIADRVAVMERGRVVESGDTYSLFTNPQTVTAKRFVKTVVRALPSQEALEARTKARTTNVYTLSFTDAAPSSAKVLYQLGRAGIEFDLIHGGVTDIASRPFGLLTITSVHEAEAIEAALADARLDVSVEQVG